MSLAPLPVVQRPSGLSTEGPFAFSGVPVPVTQHFPLHGGGMGFLVIAVAGLT